MSGSCFEDVVIRDTKVVPGPDRLQTTHYEITVGPDHDRNTPETTLLTKRVEHYAIAAAAEGLDLRFDVPWQYGRREDGRRCQVVLDLEPRS